MAEAFPVTAGGAAGGFAPCPSSSDFFCEKHPICIEPGNISDKTEVFENLGRPSRKAFLQVLPALIRQGGPVIFPEGTAGIQAGER